LLCVIYGDTGESNWGHVRVFRWEMWDLRGAKPRLAWHHATQDLNRMVGMPDPYTSKRRAPISFSSDEARVAVADDDGFAFILDTATGKRLGLLVFAYEYKEEGKRIGARVSIQSQAFSTDWKRFFGGGMKGNLYCGWVKDHLAGKHEPHFHTKAHKGDVLALVLGGSNRLLASGAEDGTIRLWDAATGRAIASWRAHDEAVTALVFSPDGRALVSAASDGTLKVWNLALIAADLEAAGLGWDLPEGLPWKGK
jgi:WD40 repeat protein